MRADVQSEYPEDDVVPASILAVLEATNAEQPQKKRRTSLVSEKNATPGDGGQELADGLANLRPHSVALDKSAATTSATHSRHKAALEGYGTLDVKVQQKDKEVLQFHPKYISQALPICTSSHGIWSRFLPSRSLAACIRGLTEGIATTVLCGLCSTGGGTVQKRLDCPSYAANRGLQILG